MDSNKYQDLITFMHKSKNLDFVPLSDSVLSSADSVDAESHARTSIRDYRAKNTDYRMLDMLKETPGIDMSTIRELHHAVKSDEPVVTKYFCDSYDTLSGILHYGDEEPSDFTWNQNFRVARSILEMELGNVTLQPIRFSSDLTVSDIFTNKTASAGAIGSGGKERNWLKILNYANILWQGIESDSNFSELWIPAIPAHRAQFKDISFDGHFNPNYGEKNRLIWVVDAATVVIEALFARPMIAYTKRAFRGYAGGKTPQELTHYITQASGHIPYWYCTDYSKFDQTIPSWLIKVCFDEVRRLYPAKYKKYIDWIQYNFINTKMLLPDGSVVQVHKGIPSGSNFTQLIGSMANFLMGCTYLASLFDGPSDYKYHSVVNMMTVPGDKGVNMYVMGDDNLFFVNRELNLDRMAAYLTSNFGVKVNADKTVSGYMSNPLFLHRKWTVNGCDRDQVEMCLNLIFPERKRDYDTYEPIDIIYSLYYTFPLAFHENILNMARWFRSQYEQSGRSAAALAEIPTSDLPGSAKVFDRQSKLNYIESFNNLVLAQSQ